MIYPQPTSIKSGKMTPKYQAQVYSGNKYVVKLTAAIRTESSLEIRVVFAKKKVSKFVELDEVAVQVGHKKLKHGLWK